MIRHRYVVALTALWAGAAHAQPAALTRAAESEQKTAPLGYQSPFADYRPFKLEPLEPWPALNDRMRDLGGHMGALQDEPAPGPAANGPRTPPPAADRSEHQH
mgnify:FL=1|jgi:hypothetical protein